MKNPKSPTLVSLFAGGGGSSLGYKNAGCNELLAIDFDKNSCDVLQLNNPDLPVWEKDIKKITAKQIMEATGLQVGETDILGASPPCQGFSMQNTKRDPYNPLNRLIYHTIRLIRGLQPKVFIIENVPGMVQGKMNENWLHIEQVLNSLGYKVRWKILDASHYGVPQERKRVIIIGVRGDLGIMPTFPEPDLDHIVTFTEATGKDGFLIKQFGGKVHSGDKPCCTITKNRNVLFYDDEGEHWLRIDDVKVLCGFPRDYKLIGSYDDQWARLGNAVMPPLMETIAKHIRKTVLDPLAVHEED
jgi:DNA (cytosine-5)-methyltransferase 1